MTPSTKAAHTLGRKKFLACCNAIAFVIFLSIVVLAAFLIPRFYIQTQGEAEMRGVASKITTDNSDWGSKINEIIRWEDQYIKTIYRHPHFSFMGNDLYIMPYYPYIYNRVLDPSWIMFFKRGSCGEDATLFVEIARLTGMRARLVRNPGEDHAWAEVMVDNSWIHVDPSWGYYNDPGVYERSENGWGKQYSYVYAVDENGEKRNVTTTYTGTGRLIVRVEEDDSPIKNATVSVKSRFLVDSGEEGYGAPRLVIFSETDENGICIFNLGGNNYQIIAGHGNYRAVEENIGLTEGDNVYLTLSLSATGASALRDVLLLTLIALLAILGIILHKTKFSFKQFTSNLPRFRTDLHTAAGIFMMVAGFTCAFIIIPTGVGGLLGLSDLNSKFVMSTWAIFGFMGGLCSLLGSILALRRAHLRQIKALAILTAAIGIIFWFIYGGFGFIIGMPIVLLSVISLILIALSAKFVKEIQC